LRNPIDLISEETYGWNPRWEFIKALMSLIPLYTGGRVRAQMMRLVGFKIGRGTMVWQAPILTGGRNFHQRLILGKHDLISVGCFIDLAAPVTLGDNVGLAPQVMLITGGHSIGGPKKRLGPLEPMPINICDGVWVGARVTILPGITIGEGSVIGTGSVVTRDVPPHTVVAGVPAKIKRYLDCEEA
jgi:acetyltransferase-like isoleucine patch superfamily enzyme